MIVKNLECDPDLCIHLSRSLFHSLVKDSNLNLSCYLHKLFVCTPRVKCQTDVFQSRRVN